MAKFSSFQELQKAACLKSLSDNCPAVAVDPSGDEPTSLAVESTSVDVADCAIDKGVNPEEQVGETNLSIPLSIESQAQADDSDGVDCEDNADAPVTTHPDTQSEALNADDKHSDTAACTCTDNANGTTETEAQSSQIEKTTPDDNGSDKLPSSDVNSLVMVGVADSLAMLVQSLLGQEQEHKTLKMECPVELEKASLPNSNLITSVLPTYPQHFPKDEFLGLCEVTGCPENQPNDHFISYPDENFPVQVLSDEMQHVVSELRYGFHGTPAGVTFATLSVISTCIGATAVVHMGLAYDIFLNLYLLFIGKRGVKKSPLINFCYRHLRDFQKNFLDAISLKNKTDDTSWLRILIDVFTLPALSEIFRQSKRGVTSLTDEISSFLTSLHNDERLRRILTAYDCGPWPVDKKMGSPVHIDRTCLSVAGGIQPDSLTKLYKKFESTGLFDRFLIVNADAGEPLYERLDAPLAYADAFFKKCVDKLLCNIGSDFDPDQYLLSNTAKEFYVNWADTNEAKYFGTPYHPRLQKAKAQAVKIGTLFHISDSLLVRNTKDLNIPLKSMSQACRIMDWVMKDFECFYNDIWNESPVALEHEQELKKTITDAVKANAYETRSGEFKISNAHLESMIPNCNSSQLKAACKELGMTTTTSCKQPDGKYGRGYVVPGELMNLK